MQRIVIDAHCHALGLDVEKWRKCSNYREMQQVMVSPGLGHPEALIERMDRFGIDKACINGGFGAPIEMQLQPIRMFPDRFIGFCSFPAPFTGGKDAARHIGEALKRPEFMGIGEMQFFAFQKSEWPDIMAELRPIMDVAAKFNAPVFFHTGVAPYPIHTLRLSNPAYIDEVAREYPEVPIIVGHMGVQGFFYYGTFADMALLVAAKHPNVYLETSTAPVEVVEKAVRDPAIGPEKLLYGSDFPASYRFYEYKGRMYPSYGKRPLDDYPTNQKACLDILDQIEMSGEDRNLILGQNMLRLLNNVRK